MKNQQPNSASKKRSKPLEQVPKEEDKVGKTVSEYREEYEGHSGKLSEINRNIAFAGIGLVWIFTKTDDATIIPDSLIIPSILLASSLALDMLQYLYCTILWYYHFRKNEKKMQSEKTKFTHNIHCNDVSWVLWGLKILCVFVAYGFIIKYLIQTLL